MNVKTGSRRATCRTLSPPCCSCFFFSLIVSFATFKKPKFFWCLKDDSYELVWPKCRCINVLFVAVTSKFVCFRLMFHIYIFSFRCSLFSCPYQDMGVQVLYTQRGTPSPAIASTPCILAILNICNLNLNKCKINLFKFCIPQHYKRNHSEMQEIWKLLPVNKMRIRKQFRSFVPAMVVKWAKYWVFFWNYSRASLSDHLS